MFGRREDGTRAEVAPYRRIMPFLMRGKNESMVLFEQQLDLSRTLPWLDGWNRASGQRATPFHLVLHAVAEVLHQRPHLNRFVAGRRIYDRRGVFLTFAAKKAMRDDAPLATVKRRFASGESFAAMVAALTADVTVARSDRPSKVDKELSVFLRMPGPILAAAVGLLRWLDRRGLAPRALIADDPMYTSVFLANLGSLKIDAAYHHLYEYGNCPLFVTIGKLQPTPFVADDGTVSARPGMLLRYTYDERIEDGFYCASALGLLRGWVEDPAAWLGEAASNAA
jgi:hypothetical protein